MRYLILSLDYDNWNILDLKREVDRINSMIPVKIDFQIFESSPGSYHIRSKVPIREDYCYFLAGLSNCSKAYKEYSKRRRCFVIREGAKYKIKGTRSEFEYGQCQKEVWKKKVKKVGKVK